MSPPQPGARVHPDTAAGRAEVAQANSRSPQRRGPCAVETTASGAPPPARKSSPSASAAARSTESFRTSASTPSSATSRFEPTPLPTRQRRARRPTPAPPPRPASVSGLANQRVGPPVPSVVYRGERNTFLDRHAGSWKAGQRPGRRRHPIVRTTSPGRARRLKKRAPSSANGVQPIVIPGRSSAARRRRASANALRGLFARRRNVGHRDGVGLGERHRRLASEMPCSGVEMRLEEGEDPADALLAQRCRASRGSRRDGARSRPRSGRRRQRRPPPAGARRHETRAAPATPGARRRRRAEALQAPWPH